MITKSIVKKLLASNLNSVETLSTDTLKQIGVLIDNFDNDDVDIFLKIINDIIENAETISYGLGRNQGYQIGYDDGYEIGYDEGYKII